MKKLAILIAIIIASATATFGQGGRLTQDPWVSSRQGNPVAGATVAICQPLATTGASLASTIATFTMASNPITAGFKNGMVLQVTGFTGADIYFNAGILANGYLSGGVPIILVTATQVIAGPIAHADGTASSNGALLQMGNMATSCAGLSSLYSDSSLSVATSNPLTADGLGNYGGFIAPGQYFTQIYGSGITTTIKPMAVACVPVSLVCPGIVGSIAATQVAFGNGVDTISGSSNLTYVPATDGLSIYTPSDTAEAMKIKAFSPTSTSPLFVIKGSNDNTYLTISIDPSTGDLIFNNPGNHYRFNAAGGFFFVPGTNQYVTSSSSIRSVGSISDQGNACTNGELALSAGWQSTGSATVTTAVGTGQTCEWTITTGTTTAASPTITDTLTNPLPSASTVCEMRVAGGSGTIQTIDQTSLSATAPIFTFNGTPSNSGATYKVIRRCGP